MKNKIVLMLVLPCMFSTTLVAQEPDESGIGGTGRSSEPETLLELFQKPDLPERVDIPDIIVTPEIGAGAATNTGSPEFDASVPTGGVGTAAGSASPP